MRLGAWDCEILKDTVSRKIYSKKMISERHNTGMNLIMNIQKKFLMKILLSLVVILILT